MFVLAQPPLALRGTQPRAGMPSIPRNLIQIWGYKGDEFSDGTGALRQKNMGTLLGFSKEWTFALLDPLAVLRLAASLPSDVRPLAESALQIGENVHWGCKADIARMVALYCLGGLDYILSIAHYALSIIYY